MADVVITPSTLPRYAAKHGVKAGKYGQRQPLPPTLSVER